MDIYQHRGVFVTNKYCNWYYSIIRRAQCQRRKKSKLEYFESHHVLPRSLFKEYSKESWNTVLLTPREHFICHWLLIKMTTGKSYYSMCKALHKMLQNRSFSSKHYDIARKYNSLYMTENNPAKRDDVRAKLRAARAHRQESEETRTKRSNSLKGRTSPMKGKTLSPRSEETKRKISDSKRGVKHSDEHILKAAAARLGKPRRKYKRHNAYKREVCVHCGTESIVSNIRRWHNDNCKSLT